MNDGPDNIARQRFIIINLIKISGIILMLAGMALMVAGPVENRDMIGGLLFAVGFADGIILPYFLARRWRSNNDR